jgi:apolipoprotein N-acyltransferase
MRRTDRQVGARGWVAPLAATAGGLALGASFVDFRLWVLPWIAVAPLIAIAEGRRPPHAFRLGWLAGIAGIGCAFVWLVHAFQVFGGFPLPVALALFTAPVAWMGLQIGIFMGLLAWLGPLPLGLGAPLTYLTVELVFPTLFPWRLAHTQNRLVTLLQSGDLAGPSLLSFAIVWTNAGLVAAVRDRDRTALPAAVAVVALLLAYGHYRFGVIESVRRAAPAVRVGIVQGNIGIERKGDRSFFHRNLDDYRSLSRRIAGDVDMLVWPETVSQQPLPVGIRVVRRDAHPFPEPPRPLLFGGLAYADGAGGRRLYNSAFVADTAGDIVDRYDKRILVPFGEYLPLADRFPWLRDLSPATGHFSAGAGTKVLAVSQGVRVGPLICYEDVIPEPARAAVQRGANLLVNLTNDAWYGATAEPYQHQALAVWRAVEERRDFVRSTNTGLTTAVTATGAVVAELPIFVADTAVVELRLLDGLTFYARHGELVPIVLAFAWVVAAVRRIARHR